MLENNLLKFKTRQQPTTRVDGTLYIDNIIKHNSCQVPTGCEHAIWTPRIWTPPGMIWMDHIPGYHLDTFRCDLDTPG